jgi:uncharacterized Tic20 family protein
MEDQNFTPPYPSEISSQERSLGMWMHLGPLLASFVNLFLPIPFLSVIVTIILYYTQKEKGKFVTQHGKESLNFQITFALVIVTLMIVMAFIFGGALLTAFLGGAIDSSNVGTGVMGMLGSALLMGLLFFAIGIFALVVMIIGSVRANEGRAYRYPISIRFIK